MSSRASGRGGRRIRVFVPPVKLVQPKDVFSSAQALAPEAVRQLAHALLVGPPDHDGAHAVLEEVLHRDDLARHLGGAGQDRLLHPGEAGRGPLQPVVLVGLGHAVRSTVTRTASRSPTSTSPARAPAAWRAVTAMGAAAFLPPPGAAAGPAVFRDITPHRWALAGGNPVRFLNDLWPSTQDAVERNPELRARIDALAAEVAGDLERPPRRRVDDRQVPVGRRGGGGPVETARLAQPTG